MKTGFSLSPGGLLLPYHVGCLDSLRFHGRLDDSTPLAGSSAGAIAVAVHGCGVESRRVIEATIAISDDCQRQGGTARGRLLPLLRTQLEQSIGDEQHARLLARPGPVAIAYRELFPRYRPVLQQSFADAGDVIQAVCNSSMFPFFSTQFPCLLDTRRPGQLPRIVVDGFFTVPRNRFGCPDFAALATSTADDDNDEPMISVDRTVAISVFPREVIGASAFADADCISPRLEENLELQMQRLLRLATQPSSADELQGLYESGWRDAEQWGANFGSVGLGQPLN